MRRSSKMNYRNMKKKIHKKHHDFVYIYIYIIIIIIVLTPIYRYDFALHIIMMVYTVNNIPTIYMLQVQRQFR